MLKHILSTSEKVSRNQLRKIFLNYRNQLTPADIQLSSYSIFEKAIQIVKQHNAKHIAVYFSVKGEVQTQKLVEYFWTANLHVYLPIVRATQNDLIFRPYNRNSELIKNRFGIPELKISKDTVDMKDCLDLIFVPLVAFDKNCDRLGMGGGYYDRTLQLLNRNTLTVGLAYGWQEISHLSTEEWDIPLDMVITDERIFLRK